MLAKKYSLQTRDLTNLWAHKVKHRLTGRYFWLILRPVKTLNSRFAVVISKKYSNRAVDRNLCKRRVSSIIWERFRRELDADGKNYHIAIMLHKTVHSPISYEVILADLEPLLRKVDFTTNLS